MKFENNINIDELDDFLENHPAEKSRKLWNSFSPEKQKRKLELYYKRNLEKCDRIENGYYCNKCNGDVCLFYDNCKRKDVGNPQ